ALFGALTVITSVDRDGHKTFPGKLEQQRPFVFFGSPRAVQDDNRGLAIRSVDRFDQNTRHTLFGIGGKGKVKLDEAIVGRGWLDLWRKLHVRSGNQFQEISAGIGGISKCREGKA